MENENLNMDQITQARREAVERSLRTIGIEELKALGEQLFPNLQHPWRETYFSFLHENPAATFHHAEAGQGVEVIYCRSREKGLWFVPGTGLGPLQPRGLAILKEIVDGK